MTIVAGVAALDVRRVLAGCDRVVMTGEAGADYLGVVDDIGRCPDHVVVAVLARVGRVDVVQALACRIGTVVAADAVAGDIDVVEVCRAPPRGRMAVVAVVAAREVRRVLATRQHAVMAGETGAEHLRMVDGGCRCVGNRVVAVLTNVGCVDVIGGLAGCIDAVMAGEATSGDIAVIENRRYPARTLVTVVALIACDDVVGRLAGCIDAIVAAYTAPRDGRMVHE